MTKIIYKNQVKEIITIILNHLNEIAEEIPAFVHIIEANLNDPFIDHFKESGKTSKHQTCCYKAFQSDQEKQDFVKKVESVSGNMLATLCTCSCIDLIMQTNNLFDKSISQASNKLMTNLLTSTHFKHSLALSMVSNYENALLTGSQEIFSG